MLFVNLAFLKLLLSFGLYSFMILVTLSPLCVNMNFWLTVWIHSCDSNIIQTAFERKLDNIWVMWTRLIFRGDVKNVLKEKKVLWENFFCQLIVIKVKLGLACQKSTLREKLFKGGRQREMIDRQESEKKHLEGRKNVTKIHLLY